MIIEQQVELYQKNILERLKAQDLTWEETCEMGIAARNLRDLANWVMGQIAFHIEIKWGEGSLVDFAKVVGLHKTTIEQYRWVIKKFGENYKPTHGLPWSFYRLAAATEKPYETIQKIADEGYTIHQAERYVKGFVVVHDCQHDYQEMVYLKCKVCGMYIKKPEEGV